MGTLDPNQQSTILRYAGTQVQPQVPVALYNKKIANSLYVGEWLSQRRGQPLQAYSLNEKSDKYAGGTTVALDSLFARAAASKAVLYFEEADKWFGSSTAGNEALANHFAALCKKYAYGLLVSCSTETAWYALAKKGMGIVALE
ncbi:MAG TPA: hypothetical protein PKD90_13500 [Phnomibacter sp.]|nr:hypothetical protein [Phnomibacter sp.]